MTTPRIPPEERHVLNMSCEQMCNLMSMTTTFMQLCLSPMFHDFMAMARIAEPELYKCYMYSIGILSGAQNGREIQAMGAKEADRRARAAIGEMAKIIAAQVSDCKAIPKEGFSW